MKLSDLQTEWKADSKIEPMTIAESAIGVPNLHSKYLTFLSSERVRLRALVAERAILEKKLEDYFEGRIDGRDIGRGPFQHVVSTKSKLEKLINSDPEMMAVNLAMVESEEIVGFLKEVITSINGRNFTIKNYIDYQRWLNGGSL